MEFINKKSRTANLKNLIDHQTIDEVCQTEFPGVVIDSRLNWKNPISYVCGTISRGIGMLIKARNSRWRHQKETFSALLAICAENSSVPGEFLAQRPVTRSFDVFFDVRLNKQLSKQSWGWWLETPLRPLWHQSNVFKLNWATVIILFVYMSIFNVLQPNMGLCV